MPTQKTKRTTSKRRSRKCRRPLLTCGGIMPKFGADTIIKLSEIPTVKAQITSSPALANEDGVKAVKRAYNKSTEELYDIITPVDGSGVKVWSHGSGPAARDSVTAGIPGRHVYMTAGPTRAPELMGIVNRSS